MSYPVSSRGDEKLNLKRVEGLKKWLGGYKYLLPTRRMEVRFPALTQGSSQPPITPAPEDPASSAFWEGNPYTCSLHTQTQT